MCSTFYFTYLFGLYHILLNVSNTYVLYIYCNSSIRRMLHINEVLRRCGGDRKGNDELKITHLILRQFCAVRFLYTHYTCVCVCNMRCVLRFAFMAWWLCGAEWYLGTSRCERRRHSYTSGHRTHVYLFVWSKRSLDGHYCFLGYIFVHSMVVSYKSICICMYIAPYFAKALLSRFSHCFVVCGFSIVRL